MLNASPFMRPNGVTLSHLTCPTHQLLKTEFFNDFGRRFDVGYGMGACLFESNGLCAHMSFTRPLRTGPCGSSEVRFIRLLMPHLRRALQIQTHLGGMRLDHLTDASALDHVATGVLVVSRDGRVLIANARAERLLRDADGLLITPSGLATSLAGETQVLRSLITASAGGGRPPHAGGIMRLSCPSGRTRSVLVAPVRLPFTYPTLPAQCATVLVADPEGQRSLSERLALSYGLTRAEALVGEQLLNGQTLTAAAEALRITRETVRTHMKQVFRKARVSRQADFVRLAAPSMIGGSRGLN